MLIVNKDLCPHDQDTTYTKPAIVHCVSACGVMGAGFAAKVPFAHKTMFRKEKHEVGSCFYTSTATSLYAHLVTKPFGYNKPTMLTFTRALTEFLGNPTLHLISREWHSPLIGCGLDRLNKDKVIAMIEYLLAKREEEINWYLHMPENV